MTKRLILFLVAVATLSLAMQGDSLIAENAPKIVRLAILTDVHVSPGIPNEEKLREAVAEINATDVDAVLWTGDLTNEGSD